MVTATTKMYGKDYNDILNDIVSISKSSYSEMDTLLKSIYDNLETLILGRKSVRIRGVGHLIVRKKDTGEWAGYVRKRPLEVDSEVHVKHGEFINQISSRDLDPNAWQKYAAAWDLFCDVVSARLRHGYNINIKNVGMIAPKRRKDKTLRWYITPLTQARIEQQILSESLVVTD